MHDIAVRWVRLELSQLDWEKQAECLILEFRSAEDSQVRAHREFTAQFAPKAMGATTNFCKAVLWELLAHHLSFPIASV